MEKPVGRPPTVEPNYCDEFICFAIYNTFNPDRSTLIPSIEREVDSKKNLYTLDYISLGRITVMISDFVDDPVCETDDQKIRLVPEKKEATGVDCNRKQSIEIKYDATEESENNMMKSLLGMWVGDQSTYNIGGKKYFEVIVKDGSWQNTF